MDILPFLKTILSAPGLSAYETPAYQIIEKTWQPLVDEIRPSKIGSLEALKRGNGEGKRPSVMVATHMDAIGLIVTRLEGEWLGITGVGGVDPRVLPGTPVTIYGREPIPGIIVQPPAKLLPASLGDGPVPMDKLLIDTGLTARELAQKVNIGDVVSYATEPVELAGEVISGHTLDNRASVAALTIALGELQSKAHTWDVWAVATAQEEVTLGGAYTSAFGLKPDLAIAVDVTFAKGPGANDWQTHPLGKGPALGFGPNIHPFLHKKFKELAEQLEMPHNVDVMPRMSGTDGFATQISAEGIPTMVISIPLRYMHTAVEMVAIKDIQRTGRLLAEFIAGLTPAFIDTITWDD